MLTYKEYSNLCNFINSFFFLLLNEKNNYLFMNFKFNLCLIFLTLIIYQFLNYFLKSKKMKLLILMNFFFLFFFFSTKNYMLFYIFFEMSVFPILLLILFWGYQIERLQAATYLFLYTLIFSIPSLLSIILMKNFSYTMLFLNLMFMNNFFFFFLKMMMLVKIPFFFFHVWLPKAHLEAPTIGSIILASILLKLGCYGFIKINIINNFLLINKLIFIFSMLGSIFLSIISFFQSDLKSIIAYSSIVHMNFMVLGVMNFMNFSLMSSLITMVSHGFISSLLFFKAGNFYLNFKTRKTYFLNMSNSKNIFILLFIMLFIFNFSPPPTLGSISEILFFVLIYKFNLYLMLFLIFFGIVSSFFCIYILLLITSNKKEYFMNMNYNLMEKMMFFFLLFFSFINFLIFFF